MSNPYDPAQPQPDSQPGQPDTQHPQHAQTRPYGQQGPYGQVDGQTAPVGTQQQWGAQPPVKQKKPLFKRWWFWLIIGIVLIAIISSTASGDDTSGDVGGTADEQGAAEEADTSAEESGAGEADAADEEPAAATYGIGDTVEADGWEITVSSVEDGISTVGDEFLNAQAQGQFVTVKMSVKNTSSSPEYFFEDSIKLADDAGNTYASDSEAGIYAGEDSLLLEEINPGNTASGTIVFDVPADVTPDRLIFEGGFFSTPVEVALS
ncbi:DUF4352 domain-containing protein [Brevibacterium luteolum]|uniref:DUF4352 domain-containing protein n=1 Tax=Brevibacterium luteolum TaxID=199591 RepID=A0A6G8KZ56_9MICO|nr:DUF4352 domain-containing protein [Brevibacterium luteolum]QIN29936.1 DUF4352 domain-containing protein [Brevibacterium luteolum]